MASKQESVSDWMALAKAYDKAEKEIEVKPWVIVSLRNGRTGEELHRYDMPRDFIFRYKWVVEWREAQLLCKNPKDGITRNYYFYDKKTGLETGLGTLISSLVSAKANVTMNTNRLTDYCESHHGDLFFSEDDDEIVQKLKSKIWRYKQKVKDIEQQIKDKVSILQQQKSTINHIQPWKKKQFLSLPEKTLKNQSE